LLEHTTNTTPTRVDISRYMPLKIWAIMRLVMTQDVPEVFEGVISGRSAGGASGTCIDLRVISTGAGRENNWF
jgi:hypothetical protein